MGNWATTLWGRLPVDPPDAKEEAELILPFNQWEVAHPLVAPGRDVCDLQLAFIRASRDNGWRDEHGRDSWDRLRRWPEFLTRNNVDYEIVTTRVLETGTPPLSTSLPLVLDGCAHVSDGVAKVLRDFVARGGRLWVVPPLGERNERAQPRQQSLLDTLQQGKNLRERVLVVDPEVGPQAIAELIRQGKFVPRIRKMSGPEGWSARLRVHGSQLCLHLLNAKLQGEPHPTIVDGKGGQVLYRIATEPAREPLVLEVDCTGLPQFDQALLESPDLPTARAVAIRASGPHARLTINLDGIRLYAVARLA